MGSTVTGRAEAFRDVEVLLDDHIAALEEEERRCVQTNRSYDRRAAVRALGTVKLIKQQIGDLVMNERAQRRAGGGRG